MMKFDRWYWMGTLCLLAMLVSGLYGLQHILYLHDIGWDYKHTVFISSFKTWDAGHYLAQIKEIYDGNYLLSNTYLAEYKNTAKPLWPVLPFYLLGTLGKMLRLKVYYLAVLMDFMLPPLIFLLSYLFLRTLTSRRCLSAVFSFVLILIPHVFQAPFVVGKLMLEGSLTPWQFTSHLLNETHCFNCFSRPVNPQFTYILLATALLFTAKSVITLKKRYLVFTSFVGIVLSYSYVFFSSYLYVVLGMGTILSFLLKERRYAQQFLLILCVILLGSSFFWWSVFTFQQSELQQMAWMDKTRVPIVSRQFISILFICAAIGWGLSKGSIRKIPGIFSVALLSSGIICVNQHVVTGIMVQPGHYMKYIIPQSMILAFVIVGADIFTRKKTPYLYCIFLKKVIPVWTVLVIGGIFLICLSLLLNASWIQTAMMNTNSIFASTSTFQRAMEVIRQYGSVIGVLFVLSGGILFRKYRYALSLKAMMYGIVLGYAVFTIGIIQYTWYKGYLQQSYGFFHQLAPALEWLNEHTEKESVVLGSFDYMPCGNTMDNVIAIYTHNNVYASYHSQYYAVPPVDEVVDRVYNMMLFMGITERKSVENILDDMILSGSFEDYQKKLDKDVYSELKAYQVDYLFYGPREKANFQIEPEQAYSFLEKVYTDEHVDIYRIL